MESMQQLTYQRRRTCVVHMCLYHAVIIGAFCIAAVWVVVLVVIAPGPPTGQFFHGVILLILFVGMLVSAWIQIFAVISLVSAVRRLCGSPDLFGRYVAAIERTKMDMMQAEQNYVSAVQAGRQPDSFTALLRRGAVATPIGRYVLEGPALAAADNEVA
jgi:hypothetical protein